MPEPNNIAVIILAAGLSRRMGQHNKLLQKFQGKPLIHYPVNAAIKAGVKQIILVSGYQQQKLQEFIDHPAIDFQFNPDYDSGMASSIRCGINAINDDIDGALVLLGDMPLIGPGHINRLITAYQPGSLDIVAPYRDGKRGNPLLWGRHYFASLATLSGDTGAKQLLKKYQAQIKPVTMDDEAIFLDIDTATDLQQAEARKN